MKLGWAEVQPPSRNERSAQMEKQEFQEVLLKMVRDDSSSDRIWDSTPDLAKANVLARNPETRSEGIAMLVDFAKRFPNSSNVCSLVAQALAWDGRQNEAIEFIRNRFPEYLPRNEPPQPASAPSSTSGVRFLRKYTKIQDEFPPPRHCTYERYEAKSASDALAFPESRTVTERFYYIEVETPEGLVGKDINGVYEI